MPPATAARALALCAAVLAVLAVTAVPPASAAVVSDGCLCSDVRPRRGVGATHVERFTPAATCLDIRAAGQCDEDWLLDTVKELEGDGYCMITCGRCKCCQPVAPTLRGAGLTSLLDAAKGTQYETLFNDPAFEATILVPAGQGAIRDVGAHVLLPVEAWGRATWTPELLAADPDGQLLVGPGGAYVKSVIQACKATVIVAEKPPSAA